jgi:REP element-mobilizing transposase RayT
MVDRLGLEVHAYALMPNHHHLLVRSVHGNLSEGMQYLHGTYTLWLNRRHRWDGPVFRGRFRSQLVDDETYLRTLLAYIHLNPVEAHLVRRLQDECWTSHRAYIGKEEAPAWLTTRVFLDLFGGAEQLHGFVQSVRRGAVEYPEDFDPDTGLFKKKAIERPERLRPRPAHGLAGRPAGKANAKRDRHRLRPAQEVLAEVARLTGGEVEALRQGTRGAGANPARRFAIWALNRSSELSQREIAGELGVSLSQVVALLWRLRNGQAREPLTGWITTWLTREENMKYKGV